MKISPIHTVAVLGAGIMGQGIARVCAGAGFRTLLFDISEELIRKGMAAIENSLEKDNEKGKLSAKQRHEIKKNIIPCSALHVVKADLVIEAVVENLGVKQNLFREIEKTNAQAVLATNTSSLSVSQIASVLKRPGRCVGLHFFNPAPVMKLVEVVAGSATDPELIPVMVEFSKKLGKIPVVAKDSPGFIVNRVARHYYLEPLKLLEESVSDVRGVDRLLRSAGFRMGPFELMDWIGIDTNFAVTVSLYHAFFEDPKFRPSRIQQQKIDAGHLGRKNGKGFYDYEKN
jgi:3-hydroxybutyryl-CoA dehydrogenase